MLGMWHDSHTAAVSAITGCSRSPAAESLRTSSQLSSGISDSSAQIQKPLLLAELRLLALISANSVADVRTGTKPKTHFVLKTNIRIKCHSPFLQVLGEIALLFPRQ